MCLLFLFCKKSEASIVGKAIDVSSAQLELSLGKHLETFLESEQKLTIQDVISSNQIQWSACHCEHPNFGYTDKTLWLRFSLKNPLTIPRSLNIELPYPHVQEIELNEVIKGQLISQKKMGANHVGTFRKVHLRSNMHITTVPPNTELTVYVRAHSITPLKVQMFLRDNSKQFERTTREEYFYGAYYGLLLSAIFYNIFLYSSTRDPGFGSYVLYLISMMTFQLSLQGYHYRFFPQNLGWMASRVPLVSAGFLMYLLTVVTNQFLSLSWYSRRMTYALKIYGIFALAVSFLNFAYPNRVFHITMSLLGILSAVIVIIPGITVWKFERTAKYFVLAFVSFLIMAAIWVLQNASFIPANGFTENAMLIGSACEAVLLSFAVGDKINAERSAKQEAQLESLEHHQKAIEAYEKAARLKDDFLASTSRELRIPLTGIIHLSDALLHGLHGRFPESGSRELKLILTSAKRLTSLVDDILDLSRIKEKSLELTRKSVDLPSVVDVTFSVLGSLAHEKHVSLIKEFSDDFPNVHGDEHRIQQILMNLVANSIRFSDKGTIIIRGRHFPSKNESEISVCDEGVGISKSTLSEIFEPPEKKKSKHQDALAGAGLGLHISKKLVELHGGHLRVESEEGEGTQVYFTLPSAEKEPTATIWKPNAEMIVFPHSEPHADISSILLNSESVAPLEKLTTSSKLLEPEIGRAHILLVEDDIMHLAMVECMLRLEGYKVTACSSGTEARALLAQGLRPDAAILDIVMPRISGFDLCQSLRAQHLGREMPILLMAGPSEPEVLLAGFQLGATDYLGKPVMREELVGRLQVHLSLARALHGMSLANERLEKVLRLTRELGLVGNCQEAVLLAAEAIVETLHLSVRTLGIALASHDWTPDHHTSAGDEFSLQQYSRDCHSGKMQTLPDIPLKKQFQDFELDLWGNLQPVLDSKRSLILPGHYLGAVHAIIIIPAPEVLLSKEDMTFLEAVCSSLGASLTSLRVEETERRNLLQNVSLASQISDRLNSPLLVLQNILESIDKKFHEAYELPPQEQERIFAEIGALLERRRGHLQNSLESMLLVSQELSRVRDFLQIEATATMNREISGILHKIA
jgi:signal transduction histidine kinase/DNA-binding response OmpR family regulator